jgi:hypothetical protein
MYFTEGKDLEYEKMMREIPGFNRGKIKPKEERQCADCFYHNKSKKKCPENVCILPEDEKM